MAHGSKRDKVDEEEKNLPSLLTHLSFCPFYPTPNSFLGLLLLCGGWKNRSFLISLTLSSGTSYRAWDSVPAEDIVLQRSSDLPTVRLRGSTRGNPEKLTS